MADIVSPEVRSRMMAGIRGKNTKIEVQVRKLLYAKGIRYRLHGKNLPGKPDLVLRRYKAVILIHGCYWHGHDCGLFRLPKTNREFWSTKILSNKARDKRNIAALRNLGLRTAVVWECALRNSNNAALERLTETLIDWLKSDTQKIEICK